MVQQKIVSSPNPTMHLYNGNKYKIRSILLSLIFTFIFLIALLVILYLTHNPIMQIGGDLLLTLTRIAFIVLATPVAIITLFIGHRIDDAKNKTTLYPLFLELIGVIGGLFLGWAISAEWSLYLTITNGYIWSDPTIYAPYPIISALITYLFFKGTQYLYSRTHKMPYKQNFLIPFIFFLFSLPILGYSMYGIYTLLVQEASQNSITIANFHQIPLGNTYQFTADITVPEDYLYHITASVGQTPHPTSALNLRLNGVANLDNLYNFQLTKGVNKLTYSANPLDCANSTNSASSSMVTFYVSKVLADRFTIAKPKAITQTIMCH